MRSHKKKEEKLCLYLNEWNNMNQTQQTSLSREILFVVEDYYIVAILSFIFNFVTLFICISVLIVIWQSKRRLHRICHLLICNTCVASIIYSIVTINNYIYLIFIQWDESNLRCRFRAYFTYVGICGEMYSYLIQSLSRFILFKYSFKYRWLKSSKTHSILIAVQWIVVLLLTLSSLLSTDVSFVRLKLCLIPTKKTFHTFSVTFVYYLIPLLTTILLYINIYYCVKKSKRNAMITIQTYQSHKRDLKLLRNIVLLILIYLIGGFPTIIYLLIPIKYLYLLNLITQSLTVTIAKISIILLDRQLRNLIKNIFCRTRTVVMPFRIVQWMIFVFESKCFDIRLED